MWIKYDGTTQFNSPTFTVTGSISASNDVFINGDLSVSAIKSFAYPTDYIYFGSGTINFMLNNNNSLFVSNSKTMVNPNGDNYDFQVKGDTDANTLFVDGSTDKVGIGTSSPNQKLTVNGSISASNTVYSASISSLSATFINELIIPVLASDPVSPKAGQI